MAIRRPNGWGELQDLCREGPRSHASSRRHRHHGQSRQPQSQSRTPAHPRGRRQALLSAEILARPEPDRAGLRQDQALLAQGRRALRRNHLHRDRRNPRSFYTRRMRQLFSKFRLCVNLNASCSSGVNCIHVVGKSSMKKVMLGAVALAAIGVAPALAADLPARVYTKAPPIVAIYDWTGFYVGGNIGYSWGRSSDTSTVTNAAGTILATDSGTSNLNGVVGGGQVGYNWQRQNWVLGLEADIQGTGERGSRGFFYRPGLSFNALVLPPVPVALTQQIDWFGTVRGRA